MDDEIIDPKKPEDDAEEVAEPGEFDFEEGLEEDASDWEDTEDEGDVW